MAKRSGLMTIFSLMFMCCGFKIQSPFKKVSKKRSLTLKLFNTALCKSGSRKRKGSKKWGAKKPGR